MAHDIAALAERLCTLDRDIHRLADARHAEHLMPLLRRSGATTVADAVYVLGMLDHLQVQVDDLTRACEAFAAAVRDVAAGRPMHGRVRKVAAGCSLEQAMARQAPAAARAVRSAQ